MERMSPPSLTNDDHTNPPFGAKIALIMGSRSDWPILRAAAEILDALAIPFVAKVVSAHRTPLRMVEFASAARANGLVAIIACAGGAAHLPGMVAALTDVPVLGVPAPSKALSGLDSLLSIVQMPRGVPVATFAIGQAGAANAALFAAAILGASDALALQRLQGWRARQTAETPETPEEVVLP